MVLDKEIAWNSLTSTTCNFSLMPVSKTYMHEINADARESILSVMQTRCYCLALAHFVLRLTFHGTIGGDHPNHLAITNVLIKRLHDVIGNVTMC